MFDGSEYEIRQKMRLGNAYNVYEGGEHVLTSKQKRFRLKEDFRFQTPDREEAFRVRADSVLDIGAAYDVVDSRTDELVGSVKRSVASFLKHEYALLDADGNTVARVREDNWLRALVRRQVTTLLPFHYVVESESGAHLGDIRGAFSLRDRYTVSLASDDIDPRLVVIAAVVIDAIEEN